MGLNSGSIADLVILTTDLVHLADQVILSFDVQLGPSGYWRPSLIQLADLVITTTDLVHQRIRLF